MRRKTPEKPRGKNATAPLAVSKRLPAIQFAHVLLFLSGMLLMALVQAVFLDRKSGAVTSMASDAAHPPISARRSTNSSPATTPKWGELGYMPFALDRPQEYFTNDYVFDETTQWVFPGFSDSTLRTLFADLELEASSRSFLTNSANWERLANGYQITVPPAMVASLKPDARRKLYHVLAQWPENKGQRSPFRFRAGGFEQWFEDCGLPRDKIDLVRGMTYEEGGNLYFSDVRAFSQISTRDETMRLVKSLFRVSTFILSVRIAPDADLNSLVSYWGCGGRALEYRPLLQSIQREGATEVPVSYFFPTFARLRLFTFPNPRDPRAAREDCFWTAMNFFNDAPDDRFFNTEETLKALQTEYALITAGEKHFGDALLLVTPQRRALHMCIQIAGDVVFTKNGRNVAQPWVLMKFDEMLGAYDSDRPYDVRVYRKKNLPAPPAFAAN